MKTKSEMIQVAMVYTGFVLGAVTIGMLFQCLVLLNA